jgi:1-acyl-sn-glycerol-3-phosphate acyltransferase
MAHADGAGDRDGHDLASGAGATQRRARRVLAPCAGRLWDIDRRGYDRLPADGPAILCPNHISFLDSAFLMLTLDRNISFVGKAEYMDSWKTKYLFPAMGMIPIDRSGGDKSAAALDAAEQVLRRGELFGIFPEGTRSRSGELFKGRTGAARLAMKLDCPIFPVGITGTDTIQPPDAKAPKLFRPCRIEIGRPILPSRYRGRGSDHLAWRSMIDEVMYEIREMTGQTYVNRYAGSTAETEPTIAGQVASVSDPVPEVVEAVDERELALVGGH